MGTEIQLSKDVDGQIADLQAELKSAQQRLLEDEAVLAQYQAEVNAFRMHCRLKLDASIERLTTLQTERQNLRTRLELLRQGAVAPGTSLDDDPFWQSEEDPFDESFEDEEELILPTDTPRDKAAEQRLYRQLAKKYHPDLGVTAVEIAYRTEMMSAVNTAYSSSDIQTLYDLADQLDPQRRAELAAIDNLEIRKLRSQIIHLRQRRRRSVRQLATLKEENTARLWEKARLLEVDDVHWWEIVRKEIEKVIQRIEADIETLNEAVGVLEHPETPA